MAQFWVSSSCETTAQHLCCKKLGTLHRNFTGSDTLWSSWREKNGTRKTGNAPGFSASLSFFESIGGMGVALLLTNSYYSMKSNGITGRPELAISWADRKCLLLQCDWLTDLYFKLLSITGTGVLTWEDLWAVVLPRRVWTAELVFRTIPHHDPRKCSVEDRLPLCCLAPPVLAHRAWVSSSQRGTSWNPIRVHPPSIRKFEVALAQPQIISLPRQKNRWYSILNLLTISLMQLDFRLLECSLAAKPELYEPRLRWWRFETFSNICGGIGNRL